MKTKKRKLIDGKLVRELPQELAMTISSKCPDKWLFVDLEDSNFWHRNEKLDGSKPLPPNPFWRFASRDELKALIKAAQLALKVNELLMK